jgi:hypothetical protein
VTRSALVFTAGLAACRRLRQPRFRGDALGRAQSVTTATAGASTLAAARPAATSYVFTALDNQADRTFNQLLGINSHDVISGYFGIGSATHPGKGRRQRQHRELPDHPH